MPSRRIRRQKLADRYLVSLPGFAARFRCLLYRGAKQAGGTQTAEARSAAAPARALPKCLDETIQPTMKYGYDRTDPRSVIT
jgi:hypothetical protein